MNKLLHTDLTRHLATVPDWLHDSAREAIRRQFRFADFSMAFAFMTRLAMHAEQHNHHPEWSNVYNRVDILLTTHDASGLTVNDFEFATFADRAFAEMQP